MKQKKRTGTFCSWSSICSTLKLQQPTVSACSSPSFSFPALCKVEINMKLNMKSLRNFT